MSDNNDIYSLIHGDCASELRALPGESINLTVTSPPYDNLRTYNGSIAMWGWDKFMEVAQQLFRVTKPGGGGCVWVSGDATIKGSETGTSFRQALYFMECGFNLHDTMIYKKRGTGACGSNRAYWQAFEYMFVFSKGRMQTVNRLTNGLVQSGRGGRVTGRRRKDGVQKIEIRPSSAGKPQIRCNVWEYLVGFCNGDEKTGHPAVFPEQLAIDHILSWTNPGDTVLDPFMGSGTTGKAALLTDRRFIGIEVNDEYFEIARRRVSGAHTNLNA